MRGDTRALNRMVRAVSILRSGDHAHVILGLIIDNPGTTNLTLTSPIVNLFGPSDKALPTAVGPLMEPVTLTAQSRHVEVDLNFWLSLSDLHAGLELEVEGQRILIKAATPFDVMTLPEAKTVALDFPVWKVR